MKDAIAEGVVAIDGYSVGLSTEDATIAAASRANIPIFLMYGYSHQYLAQKDVVGFEQVNLSPYSFPVGAWLKSHVTGQVAVITGQLGRGDAEGYRTGFLEGLGCSGNVTAGLPTLSCVGGKIQYVDTETGHWLRPDAYMPPRTSSASTPTSRPSSLRTRTWPSACIRRRLPPTRPISDEEKYNRSNNVQEEGKI